MFVACEMFTIHNITIAFLCGKHKQFVNHVQKNLLKVQVNNKNNKRARNIKNIAIYKLIV